MVFISKICGNHGGVETILRETDWTREEVFKLAVEAREDEYVTLSQKTGYRIEIMTRRVLSLLGIGISCIEQWVSINYQTFSYDSSSR